MNDPGSTSHRSRFVRVPEKTTVVTVPVNVVPPLRIVHPAASRSPSRNGIETVNVISPPLDTVPLIVPSLATPLHSAVSVIVIVPENEVPFWVVMSRSPGQERAPVPTMLPLCVIV